MKPIPYGRQEITPEDIDAVSTVLQSDFLTQGSRISTFEENFANYIGAQYAVAVANGTAALHLSCLALNLREGQKVITTPITFAASANCIHYCGGEVDFVDIDPTTALMDLDAVEKKLKRAPKGTYAGIIPVDFAGNPVQLQQLHAIADEYDVWILEDACHAPGGYVSDSNGILQKCGNGTFADLAIFSFHPVKHIACGEGGMITTNSKELYEKLLVLRTHGITKNPDLLHENHGGWYYEMHDLGYNYRLSDIHAALGISQLERAQTGLEKRQAIAAAYLDAFKDIPEIKALKTTPNGFNAYHLFVILTAKRNDLYTFLKAKGVFAQVHYIPVHYMPYYKAMGWKKGDFPEAENYYEQCLSLPMYPSLSEEDQALVIHSVIEFFEQ
jgi:UDP-4-amino-4,6-dideoxy-N-acetyl-beta-L-altrosamine transaminase